VASARRGLKGLVLGIVVCMVAAGCQSQATSENESAAGVVVDPMNPPSGQVLRVWSSGDCTISLGASDGLAKGDWLAVMRNGEVVQHLEVLEAQETLCYCHVATPRNPVRPRVDDVVKLEPKNMRDVHEAS